MGIVVTNLSKSFPANGGKVKAVDHVSFKVRSGEIFGLLGPNGAGKTTTVRLLSTILRPDSGTAVLDGHDLARDPIGVRKIIGMLPEEVGLYDRLTPIEVLYYYGKLYGMPEEQIKRRIEELILTLNLEEYAEIRCCDLSKGTKQKVSVARVFLHEPPILLLDEPTAGIDAISARAIRQMITGAKNANRTIMYSTHVMPEAERICDRIGIINRGKIVAVGTFDELRRGREGLEDIFVRLVKEEHSEKPKERRGKATKGKKKWGMWR